MVVVEFTIKNHSPAICRTLPLPQPLAGFGYKMSKLSLLTLVLPLLQGNGSLARYMGLSMFTPISAQ
jgi:hypothetical protein